MKFRYNLPMILILYVAVSQCGKDVNEQNSSPNREPCWQEFQNVTFDDAPTNQARVQCESEHWPNFRCSHRRSCFTMQQTCDGYDDCGDSTDECDSMCWQTFQCHDTKQCISMNKFCDGKVDCDDGSDEILANDQASQGFVCANQWNSVMSGGADHWKERRVSTNVCAREFSHHNSNVDRLFCVLPSKLLCDGINHCGDHSDECSPQANCSNESKFFCKNGRCIAKLNVCDGNDDCGDASDECFPGCSRTFTCKDGSCIAFKQFCDGIAQCQDGTDELTDVSKLNSSAFFNHSVICSNINNLNSRRCLLPSRYNCDGVEQCQDREDECVDGCNFSFRCANDRCIVISKLCDRYDDCGDMSDECVGNCRNGFFHCKNGSCLSVDRFCDGVMDCSDGEDEDNDLSGEGIYCSGISGLPEETDKRTCRLPDRYVCDGLDHCKNREDECDPDCNHSFYCDNGTTCVSRWKLCDGMVDCMDLTDEPNLKKPMNLQRGFKCNVLRYDEVRECVIPQKFIGDKMQNCVDGSDLCFTPSSTSSNVGANNTCMKCIGDKGIVISSKQICDGVYDCPDLSDECLCENNNIPQICQHLCFDSNSETCSHPGMIPCLLSNNNLNSETETKMSLKVNENPPEVQWIMLSQFCDGNLDCLNAADELFCDVKLNFSNSNNVSESFPKNNSVKPNAMRHSRSQIMTCFRYQSHNMWTPEFAKSCDGNPECFNMEDECDMQCDPLPEFCNSRTSTGSYNCPGNHILPGKKVCNGRIDCEASNADERHCLDRFSCQTGRIVSVKTEDVCDFKADCEDASDEKICLKTHFYCKTGLPVFTRRQKVMDGIVDCADGSDECPEEYFGNSLFSSKTHMIKQPFLQGMVWVMGLMATFGNLTVFINAVRVFKASSRKRFSNLAVVYNLLVFNLALADFLMGLFLLYLGVQNVLWSGEYCLEDRSWRTGLGCNVLGVLSTLSAEVSLTSLAVLSSYRVYCVLQPIESRGLNVGTVLILMSITWALGSGIAFLPLYKPFSDYFLTDVWMKNSPHFVNDIISKETLEQFCRALMVYKEPWAKVNASSMHFCSDWKDLISSVTQLNSNTSVDGFFGYYSRTATCLPKLFLTRSETSWEFSVGITIFNLVICIYIVCVYIIICRHRPSKLKSFPAKQTKTMHKRIALLIGTDCACWLPICLVVILRFSGCAISDDVYAFAAIVLLPINSAVNPLFHSNTLPNRYGGMNVFVCFGKLQKHCNKRHNSETSTEYNKAQTFVNRRNAVNLRVSTVIESRVSENSSTLIPLVSETRL